MWVIIPAVSFGEAAIASWANSCRNVGSKTYHRCYEGIAFQILRLQTKAQRTYLDSVEPSACRNQEEDDRKTGHPLSDGVLLRFHFFRES